MKFETFKPGRWQERLQYKSFEPVPVNHDCCTVVRSWPPPTWSGSRGCPLRLPKHFSRT